MSTAFRAMFSLLTPNESSFQKVEDVPPYVQQATPFFVGLIFLELAVGVLKTGTTVVTISDGLTSISAGMISRLPSVLMRGCELTAYMYVWDRFHLVELPWDSAWTWWLTFLGVDFCYYWLHRFAHEVAILWAAHQVHHSSEYYNLTTALRQSLTQQFTSWIFYLPMALALPPSVFAVHIQLNLLYQFWIHTELIRDLGPLEWVFNTPKHHRVHHGRNHYCIDKNYGGILIIWDRLFGTFAEETDKVVYGLVFPIKTFEILYVQFHYYSYLWRKSKTYKAISNKLSTFIKGPSWKPGKSRLGDHVDNPKQCNAKTTGGISTKLGGTKGNGPRKDPLKVTGKEVPHDPSWPLPLQVYVVIHFLLVLQIYHDLFENKMMLSQLTILGMTNYILLTLTALGFIIDQRPTAAVLEMLRCVVMVTLQKYGYMKPLMPLLAVPTELLWGTARLCHVNPLKAGRQSPGA
ncbi:alkylglycerol monooxygenase isoform X3 [Scophthalmus maximus]|uniref:alkylglycerol monooxygenase isoform X3 n=1 Tax=Scophthalmus maximus TaxID=52904 RepID=UPI001FA929B8|nr:alkylglycerol monooxygenase isoform X3 [Scophthalmus maximus]